MKVSCFTEFLLFSVYTLIFCVCLNIIFEECSALYHTCQTFGTLRSAPWEAGRLLYLLGKGEGQRGRTFPSVSWGCQQKCPGNKWAERCLILTRLAHSHQKGMHAGVIPHKHFYRISLYPLLSSWMEQRYSMVRDSVKSISKYLKFPQIYLYCGLNGTPLMYIHFYAYLIYIYFSLYNSLLTGSTF